MLGQSKAHCFSSRWVYCLMLKGPIIDNIYFLCQSITSLVCFFLETLCAEHVYSRIWLLQKASAPNQHDCLVSNNRSRLSCFNLFQNFKFQKEVQFLLPGYSFLFPAFKVFWLADCAKLVQQSPRWKTVKGFLCLKRCSFFWCFEVNTDVFHLLLCPN